MQQSRSRLTFTACIAVVLTCVVAEEYSIGSGDDASCRDAWQQPFAVDSIWNTAIGSHAKYTPVQLYTTVTPQNFHNDQEFLVRARSSDPLVPWHNQGTWGPGNKCTVAVPKPSTRIQLPADWTSASDGGRSAPWQINNNPMGLLLPDNRTLVQMQPAYRCATGPDGPFLARWGNLTDGAPQRFPNVTDLFGSGALGAHGGSGLSGVGGSIRLGELLPHSPPIAHALKLEGWGHQLYYGGHKLQPVSANNGGRCQYVWPATGSDSGSEKAPGGLYTGTNPALVPGALLAIPPELAPTVVTSTEVGSRIKQALTDYGGYIVDSSGSNMAAVCMDARVNLEMRTTYGYAMTYPEGVSPRSAHAGARALYADLLAIFRALHAVTNNTPTSVGGGGTPRRPPALPLCPQLSS